MGWRCGAQSPGEETEWSSRCTGDIHDESCTHESQSEERERKSEENAELLTKSYILYLRNDSFLLCLTENHLLNHQSYTVAIEQRKRVGRSQEKEQQVQRMTSTSNALSWRNQRRLCPLKLLPQSLEKDGAFSWRLDGLGIIMYENQDNVEFCR